ncbi:hypothetical protein [Pararhizobium sp.]|uniref:hypothetical protein n=1 Tax=Pararhizobium sp. TaxID=1977563 RepID=UPI00271665E5|nr:hypothetical protein [Pararhizobium sp.]MDO9416216.1 hypothetical protein [Pararhizobium sp.]
MLAHQKEDPRPQQPTLEEEARAILEIHGGNGEQAIMTLLVEMDALQDRLLIARIAMGHGFTRGWKA